MTTSINFDALRDDRARAEGMLARVGALSFEGGSASVDYGPDILWLEEVIAAAHREKAPRARLHALEVLQGKVEGTIAAKFGEARGWKRALTSFTLEGLAGHRRALAEYHHDLADHPYCYRRDRRSVALVAHIYSRNVAAWRAQAGLLDLDLELPDIPSWWNHGCKVVVWTRRS